MTNKLTRDIIQSEIADFFAGVVEIHTELGGPNTVEEAQNQLTERVLACVPAVDSEPVAWTDAEELRDAKEGGCGYLFGVGRDANKFADPRRQIMLYRHAQQPVVQPAVIPEWTNEQCLEFLSIAFRHAEIKGDLDMDDIRLGIRMVNASRAAMLNGGKS
ncbi:hypothetical protein [Klebsiella oxytoca]|uniref:hypothetical protein n=1 Tax=Klebsiella oxytoca TaxID=571 RepID=UPI003A9035AA